MNPPIIYRYVWRSDDMNFDSASLKKLLSIYSPEEIAKYIRLSLADEYNQNDESESVANQRRLLNEFIDRNGNAGEKCERSRKRV